MLSGPISEQEYKKDDVIKGEVLHASEIMAGHIAGCLKEELKEITDLLEKHNKILVQLIEKCELELSDEEDEEEEKKEDSEKSDSSIIERQETENFNDDEQ